MAIQVSDATSNFSVTAKFPLASADITVMAKLPWDNIGLAGLENGNIAFYDLETRTLIQETKVTCILVTDK